MVLAKEREMKTVVAKTVTGNGLWWPWASLDYDAAAERDARRLARDGAGK